jgi:DNA mismatch repair ATPase MutS
MGKAAVIVIVTVAAIAVVVAAILLFVYAEKKLRQRLAAQFGTPPTPPDEKEVVSGFWDTRKIHKQSAEYSIDDITWTDLDMDRVYAKINACHTSVGAEYLYAMLHEPSFDSSVLEARESLMALLESAPEKRLDLQVVLAKMGKMPGNGLSAFCYEISNKKAKRPWLYNGLAILPFLCTGLMFISPSAGGILLFISFVVNMAVHLLAKKRLRGEMLSIRYFGALLWAAQKICKTRILDEHPIGRDIRKNFDAFKQLGGKLSGMLRERISDMDAIIEYIRIIFLSDVRAYNRIISVVEKHQSELLRLFESVGTLDALISVLSYRKTLKYFCCPEFTGHSYIETENICHPLLSEPVPNTVSLRGSALVSGSNASGKSTFIKAVAINGIFAQTIHTCTASSFKTRPALVMTSMAVRDDITAGESYFITEIKSLKRIITTIPRVFCACYIDEILKGTNTIERIAASAAVLGYLKSLDCICVVATHDIELTRMLDGYDNYHFGERITESGVEFDYIIKLGPSKTKNAIKLLEHMEFDKRIIKNAQELVAAFEESGVWSAVQ